MNREKREKLDASVAKRSARHYQPRSHDQHAAHGRAATTRIAMFCVSKTRSARTRCYLALIL
ncbi:MAG: hypothetical protein Ta2A_20920 [Treponemataceae bacterium]|nr:MAG: hypothetical protein Ta2A_20920 [Treponemataceae bacterium]